MAEEKIFADGFSFKRNDNAPEFVVGKMSIKMDEAIAFIKANANNGWVNLDIKQAKGGNYYCELDTWVAKPKSEPKAEPVQADTSSGEDLPF